MTDKANIALAVIRRLGSSEKPIPARNVASVINIKTRQLRVYIAEMRDAGHVICSKYGRDHGYWVAEDESQKAAAKKRIEGHAIGEFNSVRHFGPPVDPNQIGVPV
jgi:hypothetical protein